MKKEQKENAENGLHTIARSIFNNLLSCDSIFFRTLVNIVKTREDRILV